jgi:hypothetical protein
MDEGTSVTAAGTPPRFGAWVFIDASVGVGLQARNE